MRTTRPRELVGQRYPVIDTNKVAIGRNGQPGTGHRSRETSTEAPRIFLLQLRNAQQLGGLRGITERTNFKRNTAHKLGGGRVEVNLRQRWCPETSGGCTADVDVVCQFVAGGKLEIGRAAKIGVVLKTHGTFYQPPVGYVQFNITVQGYTVAVGILRFRLVDWPEARKYLCSTRTGSSEEIHWWRLGRCRDNPAVHVILRPGVFITGFDAVAFKTSFGAESQVQSGKRIVLPAQVEVNRVLLEVQPARVEYGGGVGQQGGVYRVLYAVIEGVGAEGITQVIPERPQFTPKTSGYRCVDNFRMDFGQEAIDENRRVGTALVGSAVETSGITFPVSVPTKRVELVVLVDGDGRVDEELKTLQTQIAQRAC